MFTRSSLRFYAVFLLIVLVAPTIVLAAGMPDHIVPENCRGAKTAANCGICDLAELAQNLINTSIFIAVVLSAILFAWAGFKFVTNMNNPGVRGDASKIFWNVMVGLVIILAAWLLIDTLFDMMTGNHLWSQIC